MKIYNWRRIGFVVFIILLIGIVTSTVAQETLKFGIEEGDSWILQYEIISGPAENESAWEYSYANETITFLNLTNNILYLNISSIYTYTQGDETFTYNYTEVYEYNLTDIVEFLNKTVMEGYFPYLLPINWTLIQDTLQELYQKVNKDVTLEFDEIQRDNITGKPVDVIVISIQKNSTYTFGNTTEVIKTYAKAKYGKKTGVILMGEFKEDIEYYEDSEKVDSYIFIKRFWIFNSTFTFWEPEEIVEEVEEVELTPKTVVTSASSAAAGAASAAVAIAVSSVGGVVAPTAAVPTDQAVSGAEEVRSKFSWKYLKYLWKLRKLKRKKKKEEIPPPKNTIPLTLSLAIIGALTGAGTAAIAFGFPVPSAILLTLVTVVVGFTLAEAGLSLFVRRYFFFKIRLIQWGKKEKLSLLTILATGLYGVISAFVSAVLLTKVIVALTVFITVPTAIVAYITLEELTLMLSAK